MKTEMLLFFILFINFQLFIPINTQSGTSEVQPFNMNKEPFSVNSINKITSKSSNNLKTLYQKAELNYKLLKSETTNITDPTLFISKWNTISTSSQSSNSTQVKLPLLADGNYNFIVLWGDGSNNTITSYNQSAVTHTYATAGIYTIIINGTLEGWAFHNQGDKLKIIDISQWGNMQLGNSGGYFYGCYYLLITAPDTPNLNGTTSMVDGFKNCVNLVGIGQTANWNVSGITNMSGMFANDYYFNQAIDNWNVSNVRDMSSMFADATTFNEPLNSWNVSKVTTMYQMFDTAQVFNQPVYNWDVSHVTNMSFMFFRAYAFEQNLDSWNVSNVLDMSYMFCLSFFDQPIGSWNVSRVTNMAFMFSESKFNQPLNSWNVSHVIDMAGMFSNQVFNQPLNSWNVSNVIDMAEMFNGNNRFNQPLGNWNVENVANMRYMLDYTGLSSANYDNLLNGWSKLNLQYHVILDATNVSYDYYGANARKYIITYFLWTISDAGNMDQVASPVTSSNYTNSTSPSSISPLGIFSSPIFLTFFILIGGLFVLVFGTTIYYYNDFRKENNSDSNTNSTNPSFIEFFQTNVQEKIKQLEKNTKDLVNKINNYLSVQLNRTHPNTSSSRNYNSESNSNSSSNRRISLINDQSTIKFKNSYCSNCGASFLPEDVFCQNCGNRL